MEAELVVIEEGTVPLYCLGVSDCDSSCETNSNHAYESPALDSQSTTNQSTNNIPSSSSIEMNTSQPSSPVITTTSTEWIFTDETMSFPPCCLLPSTSSFSGIVDETQCTITPNNKCDDDNISQQSKKRKSRTTDEAAEDTHKEYQFTLEKGLFEFVPKYNSFKEVPDEKKQIYGIIWEQFAKCARNIIYQHLQMRCSNSISHETVGCCNPNVFYLALRGTKAKYYQWYQDILWNGLKKRQKCIQFRFTDSVPPLDKCKHWSELEITHSRLTRKFGKKITKHKMKIVYISLTCNVETNQVWTSFKFDKEFEFVQ
ncbi:hypothetical protein C9374_003739 [Naegleria lovaniensis]|uniref:Uncharacterized protein n=1 Tax=Naegleria lovaniensis TaxID=51637 RepID=A0AA88GE98_NAELO|nr:uncharacterized protein C9374_012361 [Naegleria lovaniensis]XP_044551872.1 uncharacterized protein C9374_001474 [Naegleria lovaniensis]XP_044552374.1 uncharacterized protein C9374_000546 [Naegleria lovaniensis]XP_044555869.1 uncharacterized protein C9374_003739 [Naegleria lovaniensis]KAG2373258.1 hypothetical protein C9374_012361 [Naegleria lovaniensis]KAG2387880.1 hypothetical protein C9374_001474 [Naegleria lovaniensis]KAG2388382.1 hypothetical protein C9374_000546 [Naegleria lovaniensis